MIIARIIKIAVTLLTGWGLGTVVDKFVTPALPQIAPFIPDEFKRVPPVRTIITSIVFITVAIMVMRYILRLIGQRQLLKYLN